MPLFEITPDCIERLDPIKFADQGIRERDDIQRLLRDRIEVVAPGVMVLAEEFGSWEESRRRIDILGLDQDANLTDHSVA